MVRTSGVLLLIMVTCGSVLGAPDKSGEREVAGSTEVRDWSVIDTDKDGYVSADEMEAYLKHIRELTKSAGRGQEPSANRTRRADTASIKITEVRNWSAIDTDKDGYISADEMEAYLRQAWERARTSTAGEQEKKLSQ